MLGLAHEMPRAAADLTSAPTRYRGEFVLWLHQLMPSGVAPVIRTSLRRRILELLSVAQSDPVVSASRLFAPY